MHTFVYGAEFRTLKSTGNGPAFIGTSIAQCEKFMRNNTDYDQRTIGNDWWWVIIAYALNHDMHTEPEIEGANEIIHTYDWNGKLIQHEPIGGYRHYKITELLREEGE